MSINHLPGVGIYAEPNMYIRSHSMYQMRVKLMTILTQNIVVSNGLGWNTLDFPTNEPVTVADNTKYEHNMQSQDT